MVEIVITQNITFWAGRGSASASILCYKWYISYMQCFLDLRSYNTGFGCNKINDTNYTLDYQGSE